jgi:FimV-like protein
VAYQEIGENVGARVLLEEVIQGGTALQVEKAKGMLKKLLKEIDWQ